MSRLTLHPRDFALMGSALVFDNARDIDIHAINEIPKETRDRLAPYAKGSTAQCCTRYKVDNLDIVIPNIPYDIECLKCYVFSSPIKNNCIFWYNGMYYVSDVYSSVEQCLLDKYNRTLELNPNHAKYFDTYIYEDRYQKLNYTPEFKSQYCGGYTIGNGKVLRMGHNMNWFLEGGVPPYAHITGIKIPH